jgi:V/A-type H+-transporting ATPase subunit F
MKALVIGSLDAVLGFGLVGVRGWAVTTAQEINQALDEALQDPEAGIVLVTEEVGQLVRPRMDQLMTRSTVPLVVEIPGPAGTSPGRPSLGQMIQRAIGVKL